MGQFIKGDVVVIPFPFSDLSSSKRRPALVIASFPGDDVLLCQITSKNIHDQFSILVNIDDIIYGSLKQQSNIGPNKLFTAECTLILYKVGSLKPNKLQLVTNRIIEIINM